MKHLNILRSATLAILAVGLMVVPAFAVDYYLIAKPVDITMPDGTTDVTMWGYAEDVDGACYKTVVGGGNSPASRAARMAAAVCTDPLATVPGPRITVGGQGRLRVYLVNLLSEHTSLIITGQEMPFSQANNGPTWLGGGTGNRTSPTQRVRSFGREARAMGGRQQYIWSIGRDNAFAPGTYIYRSGTHPQLQVQMGLYGGASRNASTTEPYAGYPVEHAVDLFFSEIDPDLHTAVAEGNYTACTSGVEACATQKAAGQVTSMLNYTPTYFLVNGQPYNPTSPTTLLSANIGDRILLRLFNASFRDLVPMLLNGHGQLIAEDGRAYTTNTVVAGNVTSQVDYAKEQYAFDLPAGTTKDVIITPQQAGTRWIFDRRGNTTNAGTTGGGYRAAIQVN